MSSTTEEPLPPIPDKRYFAIGEASTLCGVKPHVLRYWEQEFPELSPVKRRGNRRYYRVADIQTARRIRHLLYDLGFTIAGARARQAEGDMKAAIEQGMHAVHALTGIRIELEALLEKLDE